MKRYIASFIAILSLLTLSLPNIASAVGTNLIANPSAETLTNGIPNGWLKGKWGTNTTQFAVKNPGQDGNNSLYVSMTNYTSGDAKWYFNYVSVKPNTSYVFSDKYKSNVTTDVTIDYLLSNGSHQYTWLANPIASSTVYSSFNKTFTTPSNAVKMTVFHDIFKNGWLQTDTYFLGENTTTTSPTTFSRPLVSIEFDDGWQDAYNSGIPIVEYFGYRATDYIITETPGWDDYLTTTQIKDLVARGHDIGSHTVSHPHLPNLSPTQITQELSQSKTYLQNLLGKPINIFATPYCESNDTVVAIAKQYYTSERNCEEDVNTKSNFSAYNLKAFIVLKSTPLSEIQTLLDKAKAQNGWLVLVYHQVRSDGDDWSITTDNLISQLQLIKKSGIPVVKTNTALAEIKAQL